MQTLYPPKKAKTHYKNSSCLVTYAFLEMLMKVFPNKFWDNFSYSPLEYMLLSLRRFSIRVCVVIPNENRLNKTVLMDFRDGSYEGSQRR